MRYLRVLLLLALLYELRDVIEDGRDQLKEGLELT